MKTLRMLFAAAITLTVSTATGQVIYREGPLGGQRFYAGPQGVAGGCYVGPGGQMIFGSPENCGPGAAQTILAPIGPQVPTATGQAPSQGQRQAWAGMPSPVVVRIASRRGNTIKWGSGSIVDWRNGITLVLTCAHVLQAGYEPSVIFSDRSQLPAEVLASDALHDAALLMVRNTSRVHVMPLATGPPQSGNVYWAGWGSGQYGQAAGTVLRIDGDWLFARGEPRNGDSGGPIYNPGGELVAILTEASQTGSQPWEASGPHVGWLRRFIALHWDKTGHPEIPAAQTQELPLPLPKPEPRVDEDHGQRQLLAEVAALRKAIAALELKAGPPGPVGPPGPPGKDGHAGPPGPPGKDADSAAVAELRAAVAELHQRVNQPITFHLRAEDGTLIESSEVRLGESQDLFLIPQRRSP